MMSRNLNKVWIHLVWSVKYRDGLLNSKGISGLKRYIQDHFKGRTYKIVAANGYKNHLHVLFQADLNMAISKTAKDIKGATSNWLNKNDVIDQSFRWQRGYGAFSVSPKDVDMIKKYIDNQQDHHKG
jgi:putative transposase